MIRATKVASSAGTAAEAGVIPATAIAARAAGAADGAEIAGLGAMIAGHVGKRLFSINPLDHGDYTGCLCISSFIVSDRNKARRTLLNNRYSLAGQDLIFYLVNLLQCG